MIKPTHRYLLKTLGDEFISEKDGIVVNTSIENAKYVNRYAEVLSKPLHDDSELMAGDVCIVHHNCFRTYYDMQGRPRKSAEYFRNNMYLIPEEKIYLYKRDETWRPIKDYCFVSPCSYNQQDGIYIPKKEEEHVGHVRFGSSPDFKEGDLVGYRKNREYEFDIDGEKLYRMKIKDILVNLI